MKERKSVFLLIATMITTCLIVAVLTITLLYRTAIEEERARLIETAQSQARLIEATARFNADYSKNYPGGPNPATMSQIIDAHDHDTAVGKTEFVLSKKEGENIIFLLRHRHKDHSKPAPVPFESKLAEPMRLALSGQSGSTIGLDYHGQKVLAAYEPLKELNMGIVTKMDMSEVRAPFVRTGLIVVFITVLVVFLGTRFFISLTNPMVTELEQRTIELKKLNDDMEGEINERKQVEEALLNSERELEVRNKISDTFLLFSDENVYSEILNVIMEAMGSDKGYFGYIDENGDLVTPSMTKDVWGQCMVPDKTIVFPHDSWGGLWGRSLLEKKTLYSNGPLSVPEGHISLNRAMAVPIIFQDELIGQVTIANKEIDYNQKDKNLLESIVNSMAPILKARLQRDSIERRRRQAEEALKKAHDELEMKVKQRTAELTEANEELKREIEERRLAEGLLQESEEKYRLLVKMLPGVLYRGYPDWRVEFIDEKIVALTGYTPDIFNSGRSKWSDIIVEEDLGTVREDFIHALKTEKTYAREYRIRDADGEIKWIIDRGHIVCSSRGEIEYIVGAFYDVTDHKRQELEHQQTKNILQLAFDGVPDPLILLDEELKVRVLNQAARHYYKIEKRKDISSICCFEALMRKSAPCEACQVPAIVESSKSGTFERKGLIDPNKLEQVTIYRFLEKEHRFGGALIYIRDITETRLMERKMIHSEKLASLGLAISSITHEITNPISAITFNTPILQDYINAIISIVDDHAKDRENFELFKIPYPQFRKDIFKIITNILHASKRINTTVLDLRKLIGNKKTLVKRWINIKQVIEEIISMVSLEISQRVKSFKANIPEDLPNIFTAPDAIEQVLTNLLINAAHAADKEDHQIKLDVALGNTWKDHLIIEVSDNGCGIDPESMSKIFNPFFTTKKPGQGTGLGLYLCQDLAKELGGRIDVQSEPGIGSVFRVVLPDFERRSTKRL
jgi:PAS domain S-box-containing protein